MSLSFPIGTSGEVVEVADGVLNHLERHRQTKWWHREAGGLLFARVEGKTIRVVEATGPRSDDTRSRYGFASKLERQQVVVDARFLQGLQYVGDWHSHPERMPNASPRDHRTMASRVRQSTHGFNGFLFVIIGQDPLPTGLTMLLHDGADAHRLLPQTSTTLASDLDDPGGV